MYALAFCVTVLLILFHIVLNVTHMESFGYTVQTVTVEVDRIADLQPLLRKKKKQYRARLLSCEYTKNEDAGTITVRFRFRMLGTIPLKDVLRIIQENKSIRGISI